MGKASSAKKVARAARAGGRSAGRQRRNLMFPGAIAAIVVLGVGLVLFAIGDRRSAADEPPILGDHWHAAYGIYVCDEFQPPIPEFENTSGIHSHGDGVIHIHPFSSAGTGDNATLGAFLADTDVSLSNDELRVGDQTWKEGDQTCGDEGAEVVVAQWNNVQTNEGSPAIVRRDFDDIRFTENGQGYTIAFVPEGTTDIPRPPTAANLAELGAVDDGGGGAPEVPIEGDTDDTTGDDGDGGATTGDDGPGDEGNGTPAGDQDATTGG
jgi:hypothetical protein